MYILYMMGYKEEVLFHFSTEELAEKMKEKIASLDIVHADDLFIRKVDVIEDEHHAHFELKKVDYYRFDGVHFQFCSVNSLDPSFLSTEDQDFLLGNEKAKDQYRQEHVVSEQKWKTYLDEYHTYIVEKNEYPNEVKNWEDFKETRHHLFICRPIEIGKEAIQEEWENVYEDLLLQVQHGASTEEIKQWLSGKKRN